MRKGKGFSAEDVGEREAVGLCLGDERDQAAWGRSTLYAVMRNGDIRSLCPFLPKRTYAPLSLSLPNSCRELDLSEFCE